MPEPQDGNPESVLLVDDDEFIRDIYSTKFGDAGLDVTAVENGKEALAVIEGTEFDVILIDMIMPEMDGVEFLEELFGQDKQADASVIILSNQGQPENIDAAEQFDIDGYLIKANNVPSEILEEITHIYNQNS
jgi:CheY-like chemotaxis protein